MMSDHSMCLFSMWISSFMKFIFLNFPLLFSLYLMSDSLWPHELQYARLPCPSLSPGVCSNSCPLSGWCHPTISSSVTPLSSCPQSFPASGSFPVGQLFASDGQSIGASTSASVLPMNIKDWFPLGLTCLISWIWIKHSKSFNQLNLLHFLYIDLLGLYHVRFGHADME